MPDDSRTLGDPLPGLPRILGRFQASTPGPTLLCVAGLHGNEAPGILALMRVLEDLKGRRHELSGDLMALSGNRAALAQGRRFLCRDLNRSWSSGDVQDAMARDREEGPEDREQSELYQVLHQALDEARGPVFFLDLHTTSGPGHPFSIFLDSLPSRRFALDLSVPLVFGLGELLSGTLLEYLSDRGIPAVVFEAGARDDPESIALSEAAVWVALASSGVIRESAFFQVAEGRELLRRRSRGLPTVAEVRYRHSISADDGFRMLPGFRSFQEIREGEALGHDRHGPVRAPETGRLLMPLYQDQGEDGFFLTRDFSPFWLMLSEVLRHYRAERVLPWLPGIHKEPGGGSGLVVDPRVARWFAIELLHLFGYRRKGEEGSRQRFIRQAASYRTPGS